MRIVSDIDTLRSVENAHQALFASCDEPHIGTSFPYVIADAVSQHEFEAWRYFAAFRDDALVGYLYGRRTKRNVLGISLPVFEIGTKDVGDTLLDGRDSERVLQLLIETMQADQPDCAVFAFKRMNPSSFENLHRCLDAMNKRFVWRWAGYGCCIDTSGSESAFLKSIDKGRRGDLNRRQRRLADEHEFEYACDQSPSRDSNMERFEEFMALEDSGWKGRNQTSIKRRQGYELYHRELVGSAARAGIAAWYTLRVDGRPVAMNLCLRSHRSLWLPKTAYDEQYARYAPGLLITHYMSRECTRSAEIDAVNAISGAPWLQGWNPERIDYRSLMLFSESRRSRLAHVALQSRHLAQRWLLRADPKLTDRDVPYL